MDTILIVLLFIVLVAFMLYINLTDNPEPEQLEPIDILDPYESVITTAIVPTYILHDIKTGIYQTEDGNWVYCAIKVRVYADTVILINPETVIIWGE
nr:hypothetical protein [Nanoarchaeota archaeon]